jgi:transglutaminase-like putative cysteine protease
MDLLRSGGYRYTLTPGVFGQHTADEFWFDRKAGFCEHIASSFVILMRALDVPARIVTGYQGGERQQRRRLLDHPPGRRPCLGRSLDARHRLDARGPYIGRGARAHRRV